MARTSACTASCSPDAADRVVHGHRTGNRWRNDERATPRKEPPAISRPPRQSVAAALAAARPGVAAALAAALRILAAAALAGHADFLREGTCRKVRADGRAKQRPGAAGRATAPRARPTPAFGRGRVDPSPRYWPRRPDFDDVACGLIAGRDVGDRGAFPAVAFGFGASRCRVGCREKSGTARGPFLCIGTSSSCGVSCLLLPHARVHPRDREGEARDVSLEVPAGGWIGERLARRLQRHRQASRRSHARSTTCRTNAPLPSMYDSRSRGNCRASSSLRAA